RHCGMPSTFVGVPHLHHPYLGTRRSVRLAAEGVGEQLGAETDPEHRDAAFYLKLDPLRFVDEPGMSVRFVGTHEAAHDHYAVDRVRVGCVWRPHVELLVVGEELGEATEPDFFVVVDDRDTSHGPHSRSAVTSREGSPR